MTVYVDDMRRGATVGRIRSRWSHLMADTHEELLAFAARLGMRPEWIQHEGTHREHFDLTTAKRSRAVALGAVEITYPHGTALVMTRKRNAPAAECGTPCCTACGGTGADLSGPCWDCRGTGHPHPPTHPRDTPTDDAQGGRADG